MLLKSKGILFNHINKKDFWFISAVLLVSLFLNGMGFGWGKDGYTAWSPDSIEGQKVVEEIPNLFGKWTNKYPRLQYLIDGLCYKFVIYSWGNNPVRVSLNEKAIPSVLPQKQLNFLATLSRIIILIMSAAILILVYLTARFYYADSIAGFFASLGLAVTGVFVYYNHTTCVDIPSMFWITLGVYFLLRSVSSGALSHHILMAVAFACASCTKDPMLFYAAAFALAYLVLRVDHLGKQGSDFKTCLMSLLNKNTWIALGVFLFIFALLQGILFSPTDYWERMGVWVGGRGVKEFNYGFTGQWVLLTGTLWSFYWGIGWPLLALFIISLIVTFKKHGLFNLFVVIVPLILFYVLVSMRIQMSFIRYYLPVMGLLYFPVGAMIGRLFTLKAKGLSRVLLAPVIGCYLLSLMYCYAIDMELIHDTRNQAAQWIKENVKTNIRILSLIRYPYGLKLPQCEYPVIDSREGLMPETLLQNREDLPEYIVLTNNWLTVPQAAELKEALLGGKAGYSIVSRFNSKGYLFARKNWLTIASWGVRSHFEEISPEITVMQKDSAR